MEAGSVSNRSVVRDDLDDDNYEIWSNCMEDYLVSQGIWDVVVEEEEDDDDDNNDDDDGEEEDDEVEEKEVKEKEEEDGSSSSSSSPNNNAKNINWRKKNASALHAIKMSCRPKYLSMVYKIKSAKKAWDLLAAANTKPAKSASISKDFIDYAPFVRAGRKDDLAGVERFLDRHPQAVTATIFPEDGTLLHYSLKNRRVEMATMLVNRMSAYEMEILNGVGYTPLGAAAMKNYPRLLKILKLIVSKNSNLPNIGATSRLPVTVASGRGFKEMARFFYSVTDKNILDPERGRKGVTLLTKCIESKIFDIALDLLQKFPEMLCLKDGYNAYPIYALAQSKAFPSENGPTKSNWPNKWNSNFGEYVMEYVHLLRGQDNKIPKMSDDEELTCDQARAFLQFVSTQVSTFDSELTDDVVYGAMVEAAKHGNIAFINEMLRADPDLIPAHVDGETMFTYAVKNRNEKIFNLIFAVIDQKDMLLNCRNKEHNNILHMAAMLAPPHILDRTSGSALQVQTELQWFKEVRNVVNPRKRDDMNEEKLTPAVLFTNSHEKLIDAGEKSLKDIAQSSTVVGALIVTIMFASAFTVPGGNNQDTGYPLFVGSVLFKIFIVSDALSLYSSATSVLIFLGILTSRYSEDDFLLVLPRKLMLGIFTLFFSIATMMVTFCAALSIMLYGRLEFILPIVLLAFVPVILFLSSIFPLLSKIYKSTFGPSIFDKNTKLPSKKECNKEDVSNTLTELPGHIEDEEIVNNPSNGDQIV